MSDRPKLKVRQNRAQTRTSIRKEYWQSLNPTPPVPSVGVRKLDRIPLAVLGLASEHDAKRLERRLRALTGVEEARVSFASGLATVAVLDDRIGFHDIERTIRATGFECHPRLEQTGSAYAARKKQYETRRQTAGLTAGLALLVIISELLVHDLNLGNARLQSIVTDAQLYLSMAVFWFGRELFRATWRHIELQAAAREVPLGLAALLAFGASAWAFFSQQDPMFDAAVAVVAGYHIGCWLESWLERRAEQHFHQLQVLQPRWSTVQRGTQRYHVGIEDLEPEDQVVVGPGEVIPVDGLMIDGQGLVDESAVMGEGETAQKLAGQQCIAGSTNLGEEFSVRPQRSGEKTVLGRTLQVLQFARETRARAQIRGDRLAAIVTPLTILLAVGTFVAWRLQHPAEGLWTSLEPAIATLIIATPWALGWASTVPVTTAMIRAARAGVLIHDAQVLEKLGALDMMLFEKVSGVTVGKPEVEEFEIFGQIDAKKALRLLIAVETQSGHPLVDTFRVYAAEQYGPEVLSKLPITRSFRRIPGRGVIAQVGQQEVVVGSRTLLAAKGIQHPEEQASDGQWLYLTIDGVLRVRTRIYDPLRRDSIPTVASVQNAGLRPFLVSGGSTEEAVTLAKTIGIAPDDVRAEIDTTARSEVLRILQAAGHQVGVIADAQENQDALLEADVGFALIADGNLPAESHEFLLFRPGAGGVMLAFHLATECLRIIRQNILLSAATMSLSFAAMAGYIPTYGAVIGLLTSIGLVGANGLRLRLMAQPKAVALPPPASERQTAH